MQKDSTAPNIPEDHQQRQLAIDPSASYIVQAPAGSGKTSLLVLRILRLLTTVDNPESILAITFTRKATAEMRERLCAALEASQGPRPATMQSAIYQAAQQVMQRDRQLNWQLLANPSRLNINTIDAFCAELVRRLPWSAAYGAMPNISTQPDIHYQRAAAALFNAIDDEQPWQPACRLLLDHLDGRLDQGIRYVSDMLASRDRWIYRIVGSEQLQQREVWQRLISHELSTLLDNLRPFEQDIVRALHHAANHPSDAANPPAWSEYWISAEQLPPAQFEQRGAWVGISDLLLTQAGEMRKTLNKNNGFPSGAAHKAAKEHALELLSTIATDHVLANQLKHLKVLPSAMFSDAYGDILDALSQLLPIAVAQLKLDFASNQSCDFTEICHRANQALGDSDAPSELALALDYQIQHILIDEFQDTSPSQFTMLQKLTAGWQDGDGRTLFLVGDPMQSIYGFRDADVSLFLQCRDHGIGDIRLQPLSLTCNFRSTGEMIHWFNDTFADIFPAGDNVLTGAVSYSSASSIKQREIITPVEYIADSIDSFQNIVNVLKQWTTSQQQTPSDKPSSNPEKEKTPQLVVLARSRTQLRPLAQHLNELGISFDAVELDSLERIAAVQDLVALTRALLHLADRVAWLSILRAPWCGLDLPDLTRLIGDDAETPVWQLCQQPDHIAALSMMGQTRVAHLVTALSPLVAQQGRITLRAQVEAAWLSLGGHLGLSIDHLDACDCYFDILEELQKEPANLNEISLANTIAQVRTSQIKHSAVQLMTIHKSKGLEFERVILLNLHAINNASDNRLLEWAHTPAGVVLTPKPQSNDDAQTAGSEFYQYAQFLNKERNNNEIKRLLYVAATRAERKLYLHARFKSDFSGKPAASSLLALFWPVHGEKFTLPTAEIAASVDGQQPRMLRRLRSDVMQQHQQMLKENRPQPSANAENQDIFAITESISPAQITGTIFHGMLENFHGTDVASWSHQQLRTPHWHNLLQGYSLPTTDRSAIIAQIEHGLQQIAEDDVAKWLYSHRERQQEWQLNHVDNQQKDTKVELRIIDLSFIDERGTRWIVDYKTATPEGAKLTDFLAHQRQQYAPQLQRYAQIIEAIQPEHPIELALYFPFCQGWIHWPASDAITTP